PNRCDHGPLAELVHCRSHAANLRLEQLEWIGRLDKTSADFLEAATGMQKSRRKPKPGNHRQSASGVLAKSAIGAVAVRVGRIWIDDIAADRAEQQMRGQQARAE